MNQPRSHNRLGEFVTAQRRARGLTGRALALRAGIDKGSLNRIERGEVSEPSPRVLLAIARALELDVADLYLEAGFAPGTKLPGIKPYLRAKFDLPDQAVEQIAEYIDLLNQRYSGREADDDSHSAA